MMDDLDDFSPDAIDAAVRGKAAPTYTGNFVGDPSKVQDDIATIKDPVERNNAQRAFAEQARRTPGFNKGAPLSAGKAGELDDLDPQALHAAVTGSPAPSKQAAAAPPAKSQQITSPEMDLTANLVSGLGSSAVGGVLGTGKFLWELAKTHDMDHATKAGEETVRNIQQAGTYVPRTTKGQQLVSDFGSNLNPLNWPAVVGDKVGGALTDAGLPGVGAVTNAALQVGAPLAVKPVFRAGSRSLSSLVNPAAEVPRVEPTMAPQQRVTAQDGTVLQPTGQPQPVNVGGASVAAPVPARAAPVSRPPAAPTAAPEEAFPEIEPAEHPAANPSEYQRRAKVLASVGIDTARESSLRGDKIGGSTDLQLSALDSPAGRLMESQIAREKQALAEHSAKLVKDTGGTLDNGPKDSVTQYQRGETILRPLSEIKNDFDQRAGALYDTANERAQGQLVALEGFRNMLADDSEMTSPEFVHFRDAAKAFAKKNGMLQEDGSISGNALQAETMRKWLNQKRTYGNGSFVDGLKESLDGDVMSSAGEDLYTQARALWRQKKETLDNPNGMSKLMQAEGPDGINRPIPIEQVAPKLAKMPTDQFGQIVGTLKNAPDSVKPSAQAAINEIRAHFANDLRNIGSSQAGQWNAKGVTQYLRENAGRMNQIFTPEEMGKFQNLSEAGQIAAKDQKYPGAAAQAHNLGRLGVTGGLVQHGSTAVGTVAGGVLGGHIGASAGAIAGRAAGAKMVQGMSDRASMKAAQQRMVPLADLLDSGRGQ